MQLMGPDREATTMRAGEEGNASPTESFATDNPPPSPCLDNDFNEDDVTPRQQWSPVHTVGERGHPKHTRGYNGGSSGEGTFAGSRTRSYNRGSSSNKLESHPAPKCGGSAGTSQPLFQKPRPQHQQHQHQHPPPPAQPDSPVMRIDLERLDLSVLALGEEGGPTIPHHGGRGHHHHHLHHAGAHNGRSSELLHPGTGTFGSEPGPISQEGRPRSLGGRPSRVHALFVKPGQLGTGPASPPSSYSTHSESGFASPTTRLASPFSAATATAAPPPPREFQAAGRVKKGKWKRGKAIGVGSCGNVYLGMNEDTGELMAVKEITLETKDRLLTSLYNEIQVMHKLVHPHIVGYLGAELQDSRQRLCIFQEWVPAGSLHSLLGQFGALSDAMTRKYTKQVLEGLVYLHANRVIHRDVKSKNILVDDRGNVKLADFGCALVLKDDNGDGVEMSMKGTPLFMAPEMLLKRKCGKRVDVWSLGCAVLEMVTTRPPWADTFKHPVEIIEHFSANPGPPPLPDDLSPSLRDFLLACFTWNAAKRPTSHELGGHKYLLPPRPSEDGSGSPGGAAGAGAGAAGDDDNEIPLEAMGRVPFMSRMRRCSSATLPELLQRSQALGSAEAFAPFGTAQSGTLRPPSPRYGPGGVASAHSKRTPTSRRVYTETGVPVAGVPPPDQALYGGIGCGATKDLVRRCSMPMVRSPPISPDKPRRPGRGSSPGPCSSAMGAATGVVVTHASEEEGRPGSGPITHARLRSLGDGIDLLGAGRGNATGGTGGGGGILVGGGGLSRGTSSSGGTGRTDSEASMSRSTSLGAAALGVPAGGVTEAVRQAAPTPVLPPVVRDLLGSIDHGGGARGAAVGVFPTGDTPPPTVRPLELRRSVSARARGWGAGGLSKRPALTLQQQSKDAEGGIGVAARKVSDIWQVEGGMSDARRGGAGAASGDGGGGGDDRGGGSPRVVQGQEEGGE
eukprot:g8126.t1